MSHEGERISARLIGRDSREWLPIFRCHQAVRVANEWWIEVFVFREGGEIVWDVDYTSIG